MTTLGRRRIYILPTRHGVGFGFALAAMLLGSVNYNNGLGYALTFLLGSLTLVSILHSYRNLAGLRIRPGSVEPVFAGNDARFELVVDNREQRERFAVILRSPYSSSRERHRDVRIQRCRVPANELSPIILPTPAPYRGLLAQPRVTIASRYPFGLFRAWGHIDTGTQCLVYPSPAGARNLPPPAAETTREGGAKGTGREDFSGLRDYRRGDSPRQIHWKAAARDERLLVKVFAGASAADYLLSWDVTTGTTEERLSQLCRWVLEADREGARFGLQLPGAGTGVAIEPDSGPGHRRRCLQALALHDLPPDRRHWPDP